MGTCGGAGVGPLTRLESHATKGKATVTTTGELIARARISYPRAGLVVASHALLDTLTDGGLGCALFWPFDLTRYFGPGTPIPVSPIGLRFFSPCGMYAASVELLLFAPLVWFAVRPRIRPLVPLIVWFAALWLFLSSEAGTT